ncbi:MAG: hypothetical protein H6839_15780 [Planctomycetes bacterium]|nr:hypothetical protein [Planctomycetota bacterium]
MQSPQETLTFLEQSLRSLDAETLASMAESLAGQARAAREEHPDADNFARLEAQFLRHAIRHAEATHDFARQAQLLSDLAALPVESNAPAHRLESGRAWVKAGRIDAAHEQLRIAAESAEDTPTRVQAEVEEAILRLNADEDVPRAVDRARPVGERALRNGCTRGYLDLALAECRALVWAGLLKEGELRVMAALEHAPGDSTSRRCLLAVQAMIWGKQGQTSAALELAKSAISGDHPEPELLEALGEVYADSGRHARARELWDRAVDIYHANSDRFGKARVSFLQAGLRLLEARWNDVEAPLAMAEAEFRTLGYAVCLAHAGLLRAEMLFGQRKHAAAEQEVARLRRSRAVQASPALLCIAHEITGDLMRFTKRYGTALEQYSRARDIAAAGGMRREHARGALNCAHMHLALEDLALSETQATLALGLVRRSFGEGLIEFVEANLALARVKLKRGDVAGARRWTISALEAGEDLELLEQAHALRTETLIHDLKRMEDRVIAAENRAAKPHA